MPTWHRPLRAAALARRVLAVAILIAASFPASAASISEPSTVFYGKIWGSGGPQPFLVTAGTLDWTIRRSDGTDLTLHTTLFPMRQREYSYRLDVPQSALALGLQAGPGEVPLRATEDTHSHWVICVDGLPARLLGPNGATFSVAQANRAATFRLDLEVPLDPVDTDGDGIPDWWEEQFGLNKQDPADAALDPDGDGLSNLVELRSGYDPTQDSRQPALATTEILAYAGGITGVMLTILDADSTPDALICTLTEPPTAGTLYLRNGHEQAASPDLALAAGSQFTYQDVRAGRLILAHDGGDDLSASFALTVRDENPNHAAATGTVRVDLYRPANAGITGASDGELLALALDQKPLAGVQAEEEPRVRSYILSRALGYVVWDCTGARAGQEVTTPTSALSREAYRSEYLTRFGLDRRQVILDGVGQNILAGGMESDLFMVSAGENTLRGGGGADSFIFLPASGGRNIVMDFSPGENDRIDLSRVLPGGSGKLTDYVRINTSGLDPEIEVNLSGNIGAEPDLAIALAGLDPGDADLYSLVASGRLVVGTLNLPPRVSIASLGSAAENGPSPGAFRLTRAGTLSGALTVNIAVRGSAVNGVDFASIGQVVRFAPGEATATVTIMPFADSETEPAETVEVSVLPGNAYELGETTTALLTIADLEAVVSIEVLEPLAVQASGTPGVLLITRSAVLNRSVLVRLTVGGSATAGTDYESVPRYVNFVAGQTTALISIAPAAGAVLEGGAETVAVGIMPDAAYRIGNGQASVTLVNAGMTLGGWRDREFANSTGSLSAFATADPGGFGVPNLVRYALGMDPSHPDRARLPRAVLRDGQLTMDVRRPPNLTDIRYVVEASLDLRVWETSGVERIYPAEHANDPAVMTYRANVSASRDGVFMRLRIVYEP